MPTPQDTFESYIGALPVSQDVKRSTLDAMYGAKSWDDIKSSLSKLPLAQEQRKALWDIAVSQAGTAPAAPKEQAPVPGVGSERRVIEPSLTRTPGEARWEGFKSGAVEAAKELGGNAYRSALSFVDKPAWDIATLLGYKPTEQEQTAYNAMIAPPQTTAGKVGAAVPLTAGALLGAAEVGVLPTLAGLATGYVGGKVSSKAADIALPDDMDPVKREAAMSLAEFGGMTVGGMAGPKSVLSPTGQRVITSVGKATQGTLQERVASASLSALAGHEVGGPKGAAAGGVFGAIFPGAVVKRPRSFFTDWAKGVLTDAAEKAKEPTPKPTPAPKPSFFDQNVAVIAKADEIASRNPTVDTTTPTQQKEILKTLQGGLEAHKANKTTPSDELVRLHDEFAAATTAREAAVVQQQAGRKLARQQNAINSLIEDYQSISSEAGVDWQLRSEAQVKADIKKAQDYVAAHIEAGEQPPADLVTILDAARNRLITLKSQISLAAHDEAMRSLVASATEGSQAYDAALEKLPVKTRKMLQDLEGETLNILRTRSRNAGGRLKPADDPWLTLMNDVLSERARPESVEVPVESPGGSATVPSRLDVVRVPGAAVSVPAQTAAPASASATTPATASAPAQTAAPVFANSAVANRAAKRGSTLFQARPRTGYDPVALADARQLQEMSRVYEQHEGLISPNGPIDEAFIARFKNLAYKFLGGDTRQKYTFKTKKTTPSLSTLNGAINQRYKYAPPIVRESLGLPRAPKVKD